MIIYGASGHGKVILDCCIASGIKVSCFKDRDPAKVGEFMGLPVFLEDEPFKDDEYVIGVGNNQIRKGLVQKLEANGLLPRALSINHPSSVIAPSAKIAPGTVVFHNSVIQTDTIIGQHAIINTSASIDHDCKIGDFVHVAPNVTLCGGITIGEGTLLGAGATIIPNITIGKWVSIGAGSVVTKDIPDYAVAVGNPARIIRVNKSL